MMARMKIIQMGVGPKRVPLIGYLQEYVDDGGIQNIRPTVLICPGGGYEFLSWREKDHVAMQFLAQGYNVFILEYSVAPDSGNLEPLKEASDAMVSIRRHAVEWLCDPNRVAIMGFSAGGHLAASLSCLFDMPEIAQQDHLNRPDALILCYPVITMKKGHCHQGSVDNVTGGDGKLMKLLSLEDQVGDNHPPTFIWHTVTDELVPVENSMWYAEALYAHHVSFELHLFPNGQHGLSTCDNEVHTPNDAAHAWIGLCLKWLNDRFDYAKMN